MGNTRGKKARPYLPLFGVALLVVAWQFAFPGFYYKILDHAAMPPRYVPQFVESFRQGIIYPRWMAEGFYGYGFPCFIFYPPLYYFLSSALNVLGLGLTATDTALNMLGLYMGGVFLFLLVRERHGDAAAFTAAVVYMLLPSRVFDIFFNNTPSGRIGQYFMPPVLYFAEKMLEAPFRRRYLAGMAFSYAALIMSHLITAYMFTPFVAAYGLFGVKGRPSLRAVLKILAGLGTGICLASVYFVPVALENDLLRPELLTATEDLSFWRNFVFNFSHTHRVGGMQRLLDMLRLSIKLEVCLAAFSLYAAWRFAGFRLDRQAKFFAVSAAACLFMMSRPSGLLWTYLPGFSSIIFPGRISTIYILFLSAVLGIVIGALKERAGSPKGVTALALVLASVFLLYDVRLVAKSDPVLEPDAARLAHQLNLQIESLPKTVEPGAIAGLHQDDPLISSKDDYSASVSKWGYTDRGFSVDSPRGAKLRVKTFYFPGWRAWVDGKDATIDVEKGSGAMLMDIPAGRHEVKLRFTDTWPRTLGAVISILTLAALVLPYLYPRIFLRR